MGTAAGSGVPAWLVEAIGNPLTYDAAAGNRKDVCARVDPALYRRLQAMKERLGLRTTAGAWEYVLRAGRKAPAPLAHPGGTAMVPRQDTSALNLIRHPIQCQPPA